MGQEKSPAEPPKELPKLESFSTGNVDAGVNPCDDFFAYADGKWLAAHPIPADQVGWGVESPLELWNETVLVKTLEQTSAGGCEAHAERAEGGRLLFCVHGYEKY